jgi:putative oxidoreductase
MIKTLLKENDYSRIINLSLLILRLGIAILMLTHGIPKLGKLISGDLNFPDPIGLGSTASLILTIFAEVICSLLVAAGLGTKLAVIPLIITMSVILFIVHVDEPIMNHYNVLIYLLGYILLMLTGSGRYSSGFYLQQRNRG